MRDLHGEENKKPESSKAEGISFKLNQMEQRKAMRYESYNKVK